MNLKTEIFYALIPVMVTVFTIYIAPALKKAVEYLGLNNLDEKERRTAETAVKAVEQILGSASGKEKLKQAEEMFKHEMALKGINVNAETIREKIEEAVFNMNNE